MFAAKSSQFGRRKVVSKLVRFDLLRIEHELEQLFANTQTLPRFMHIKVKYAERSGFTHALMTIHHKEVARPNFEQTNHTVVLCKQVQTIVAELELGCCCEDRTQTLCLGTSLAHAIDNSGHLRFVLGRQCSQTGCIQAQYVIAMEEWPEPKVKLHTVILQLYT